MDEVGAFDINSKNNYYEIYSKLFSNLFSRRIISKSSPLLGVSEHPIDSDNCIITAVNYGECEKEFTITLDENWEFENGFNGSMNLLSGGIKVIEIQRK